MSSDFEWTPTGSLWESRSAVGVHLVGSDDISTDFSFLSFLATAQNLRVPFLPIAWEQATAHVGGGGTAQVTEAQVNLETSFALKRVSAWSKREKTERQIFQVLINELIVLGHSAIQEHPNINRLKGIGWDFSAGDKRPWPVLVLEKSFYGDLSHFSTLPLGRALDIHARLELCIDIGRALLDMHNLDFVHGDIKPENILVFKESGKYWAKVIDFGYSTRCITKHQLLKLPISWPWNAPEHDRNSREWTVSQAKKLDIYSYGLLCFWLMSEPYLFHMAPQEDSRITLRGMKDSIELRARQYIEAQPRLEHDEQVALEELFRSSMSINPDDREINAKRLFGGMDSTSIILRGFQDVSLTADFKIERSICELYCADHRLRTYIASQPLEERHSAPSLHLQAALCYHLGFGIPRAQERSREILAQGNVNAQIMHGIISEHFQRHIVLPSDALLNVRGLSHSLLSQTDDENLPAEFRKAVTQLLREMQDLVTVLGDKHALVLILKTGYSAFLEAQGSFQKAEDVHREVVEASRELLGDEHPITVDEMLELAKLVKVGGRYDEAEVLQVQGIHAKQKILGEEHPSTLWARATLAWLYMSQGRIEEAIELELIADRIP